MSTCEVAKQEQVQVQVQADHAANNSREEAQADAQLKSQYLPSIGHTLQTNWQFWYFQRPNPY